MRLRVIFGLALLGLSERAVAQTSPPSAFFTAHQYTAYTVYDATTAGPPTEVQGVGGTLTLRPDSTYEKHFSLLLADGPHYFNQTGRFTLTGDSIRFAFSDLKGPDVQRGTFRYDPTTKHLALTIMGYPPGNYGVYELGPPAPAPKPRPAANRPAPKRRSRP